MERAGKGMIAVCFFIMLCCIAYAQVPEMMTWSGSVPRGSVESDGSYEITFALYAEEMADVPLWSETQSVQVTGGMVAVTLGAVNPLTIPFDRPYWIGVQIDGIEQREPLASVGYAFRCREAETIAGTAADTKEAETVSGITPKAVLPDEVLSKNIKEADGTTGQNTNTGSGVKTGHIQNGALTFAKIANNAVGTAKIANNAVTSPKIATGAVTDAKITGPISSSKIQQAGLDADTVDGKHAADFVNTGGGAMTGILKLPANGLVVGTTQLVASGGNIGIGTATPLSRLSLGTDLINPKKLALWDGVNDFYGLGIELGRMTFYTMDTEKMTIVGNGNVGIGTTNPAARLEVHDTLRISEGSSSDYLQLRTTGTALDIEAFNHPLYINNTSGQPTYIMGGNVGIGTAAPISKLDVQGASGAITLARINQTGAFNWAGLRMDRNNAEKWFIGMNNVNNNLVFRRSASTDDVTIDTTGMMSVKVLEIRGGADLSEHFEIRKPKTDLQPLPGMVVSIDAEHPGELVLSTMAYDRTVAGIISGAGGVKPGMLMGQSGTIADGTYPVALTGRVYVMADASYGSIRAGDLLTTSATPGHAMKVSDHNQAQGAILGKAMTGLENGKGLILVLVTLQ